MPTIFNSNPNVTAMTIKIRTLRNKTLSVRVESTATVEELKDFINRKYKIPIDTQQLFYHGRLLKDNRSLSAYKINEKSTLTQPILLTQIFHIKIFASKKVLSLYSLTKMNKSNKYLLSQKSIECTSATTINSLLKQLKLDHLSHLLKVCVGAGTDDIKEMNKKLVDIPNLLNDGVLSILFSARWFLDRTLDIATFSSLMSATIQKSTDSTKLLRECVSFNRLNYEFQKTQSFILRQFEEIDSKLKEESDEINKAKKWFAKIIQKNIAINIDDDAQMLLNQLQHKVSDIENALKSVLRKWSKKQKQIVLYLQQTVQKAEIELMVTFKSWISMDIISWLQYMDDRIIFTDDMLKRFHAANINGYNLSDINDLSLKLIGIDDIKIRQLIIGYIDTLLVKYGNKANINNGSHSPSRDTDDDNECNNGLCCICVSNEVNTVIVPCGHATYCNECSKQSIKHYFDRCPICRQEITSIIPFYKAGF